MRRQPAGSLFIVCLPIFACALPARLAAQPATRPQPAVRPLATLTRRQVGIGRIEKDQTRLRENMKALKGSAEEKQLVQRYTGQLNAHEDQLDAFNREMTALRERHAALDTELKAMLTALSLDVVVPAPPQ